MTDPPLLAARNISRVYQDGNVTAVDDVSFDVPQGGFLSLVGKSGCGKSTLLNLLGGLDEPDSGTILFLGRSLSAWGDAARFRARHLGFVFQSFHLISVLTAEQNVQLPMFEGELSASQRKTRAGELLELVGMAQRCKQSASRLSGGERQRVAIARALANNPELILADEPTGNLDTQTAQEVISLFQSLHRAGKTILMVTHDASLAAQTDRTIFMRDGRIASA